MASVKPSTALLLAGGIYLAILIGSAKKDTIKANNLHPYIDDIDLDWQRIRIRIVVQNPWAGNLVVRAIFGDLYINGDHVARMSYSGYTNIPAAGSNYFTITGTYITQNMGRLIYQMFNGRKNYEVTFKGTANLNSEMVPIEITKRFNG